MWEHSRRSHRGGGVDDIFNKQQMQKQIYQNEKSSALQEEDTSEDVRRDFVDKGRCRSALNENTWSLQLN